MGPRHRSSTAAIVSQNGRAKYNLPVVLTKIYLKSVQDSSRLSYLFTGNIGSRRHDKWYTGMHWYYWYSDSNLNTTVIYLIIHSFISFSVISVVIFLL